MLEVLEEYRNRGLGKKILKWVENLAQKQGFDRIWASDTTSMYFWQTNGYDIDIDEGLKYLDEI
jgi:GNAT superfamily N-acetyltransferase